MTIPKSSVVFKKVDIDEVAIFVAFHLQYTFLNVQWLSWNTSCQSSETCKYTGQVKFMTGTTPISEITIFLRGKV